MVKIFRHVFLRESSLEQVDNLQGMRDGKGVHTIRDSCYIYNHRETLVYGGMAADMSKVPLGLIS